MGKNKKKKSTAAQPSEGAVTAVTESEDTVEELHQLLAAVRARPIQPSAEALKAAQGVSQPLLAAAGGDLRSFSNYVVKQNRVAEKMAEIFPPDKDEEAEGGGGEQARAACHCGNASCNGEHDETAEELLERGRRLERGSMLSRRDLSPRALMYEAIQEHLADTKPGGHGKKSAAEGYKKLEALGLFSDTKGKLQRELRERKLLLLAKDRAKVLSLQDVSEHNIFMIDVRDKLGQRRDALTKRARVISVLLNKTRDARRVAALEADMERIRVAERNFNEDIAAFNGELTWFHSCPSFRKAQEHVAQHWVSLGSGEHGLYVPRSEIEQDEAESFEAMLEEMKLEGLHSGSFESHSPTARTDPLG
mmetsp:Transcript_24892/g.59132  ORF Transcript_24892/g.59132 Transcript_24892/m.59132 type:complete len:363 (+) Transcript_24892:176-1264(+)